MQFGGNSTPSGGAALIFMHRYRRAGAALQQLHRQVRAWQHLPWTRWQSAEATPATDQSEISLHSSSLLSRDAVTTEQPPVRSPHSARLTACCTAPPTGDRQTAVSGDGARGGNLHLSCAHCGIKPEYRGAKLTRLRQGAAPDCCPLTEVRG